MREITATLRNVTDLGPVVWGYIYGDTRGRFVDGEYIRTSKIIERDGDIIVTLNSVYKVEP